MPLISQWPKQVTQVSLMSKQEQLSPAMVGGAGGWGWVLHSYMAKGVEVGGGEKLGASL